MQQFFRINYAKRQIIATTVDHFASSLHMKNIKPRLLSRFRGEAVSTVKNFTTFLATHYCVMAS